MIDIHDLIYAVVILLFLTGVLIVALASLLAVAIAALSAGLIRLTKGRKPER